MVGHKCGHPDVMGHKSASAAPMRRVGAWCAVWCCTLAGPFVGTHKHMDWKLNKPCFAPGVEASTVEFLGLKNENLYCVVCDMLHTRIMESSFCLEF